MFTFRTHGGDEMRISQVSRPGGLSLPRVKVGMTTRTTSLRRKERAGLTARMRRKERAGLTAPEARAVGWVADAQCRPAGASRAKNGGTCGRPIGARGARAGQLARSSAGCCRGTVTSERTGLAKLPPPQKAPKLHEKQFFLPGDEVEVEHKVRAPWEICTLLVYAELSQLSKEWWTEAVDDARGQGCILSRRRDRKVRDEEAIAWRVTLRGEEHLVEAIEDFLCRLYVAEDADGEVLVEPEDFATFPLSQALTGLSHAPRRNRQ